MKYVVTQYLLSSQQRACREFSFVVNDSSFILPLGGAWLLGANDMTTKEIHWPSSAELAGIAWLRGGGSRIRQAMKSGQVTENYK